MQTVLLSTNYVPTTPKVGNTVKILPGELTLKVKGQITNLKNQPIIYCLEDKLPIIDPPIQTCLTTRPNSYKPLPRGES